VGGGGKTSLIEHLGVEASRAGMRVAITTTTKIWVKEPFTLIEQMARQKATAAGALLRIGKQVERGKLTGVDFADIEQLGENFDLVLIEADGAKGYPLKYPADYEPVIPPFSDRVVVVAGLDGLTGRVAKKVFRWELGRKAAGWNAGTIVTAAVFERLFEKDGLMKGINPETCIIVLNKYDACREREKVPELARTISGRTAGAPVVITSVRHAIFYRLTQLS